jgi:hypothetical protein
MRILVRSALTAVLVATALAKWLFPGIDDVWLPVWAQYAAGGAELMLAVALWTSLERRCAWGLLAIALAAICVAWVAPATVSGGCGCLGQVKMSRSAHVGLAAAVGALASLLIAMAGDRGDGPHEVAFGDPLAGRVR